MIGGSSKAGGYKAHVGESRAERRTFTVIDEATERRQVVDRRPRGDFTLPTRETVMANVAKNLSAMPEKGTATELLDAARTRKREATRGLHTGQTTYERRTREASPAPRRTQLLAVWLRASPRVVPVRSGGARHASSDGLIWPKDGCASIAPDATAAASYFPPR